MKINHNYVIRLLPFLCYFFFMRQGDSDGRLSYARALVEIHAEQELRDSMVLKGPNGEEFTQSIHYDWKPWQCKTCHKFGDNEGDCVKKGKVTQRGVVKQQPPAVATTNSEDKQPEIPPAMVHTPKSDALAPWASDSAPRKSQRGLGSWQRIIQHKPRKDPIIEVDEEMEKRFGHAMDVIQVLGSLGSWRGDRVIIDAPNPPNG